MNHAENSYSPLTHPSGNGYILFIFIFFIFNIRSLASFIEGRCTVICKCALYSYKHFTN